MAEPAAVFNVQVQAKSFNHPLFAYGWRTAYTLEKKGDAMLPFGGTLTLQRGQRYTFNIQAPGHPFYFTRNARGGFGSARSDRGALFSKVAETGSYTITIDKETPDEFYYQCALHAYMGGSVRVTSGAMPTSELVQNPLTADSRSRIPPLASYALACRGKPEVWDRRAEHFVRLRLGDRKTLNIVGNFSLSLKKLAISSDQGDIAIDHYEQGNESIYWRQLPHQSYKVRAFFHLRDETTGRGLNFDLYNVKSREKHRIGIRQEEKKNDGSDDLEFIEFTLHTLDTGTWEIGIYILTQIRQATP